MARAAAAAALLVLLASCAEPPPGEPPLRFVAFGDYGTGGPAQRQVARQLAETYRSWGMDFVLLLGDNFYNDGVDSVDDPLWRAFFEDVYDAADLPIPFYAVNGNHDHKGNADAQIAYTERSARWRMPDHHYVFQRGAEGRRVDFFALDLMELDAPFGSHPSGLAWLEAALAASAADHKIVFGHFAIWSSPGRYGDNEELIERLAPVLKRHAVDLYLAGHEHHLEIQKPRDGLVQIISGAGSQTRDVAPGHMSRFASGRLGFMWFEIDATGIEVRVVSRDGETLFAGPVGGDEPG